MADNGSSTDKAPSAASELVIARACPLVLGSYGSGVSMAGGPTSVRRASPPSA